MKNPAGPFLAALLALASAPDASSADDQCHGHSPMESVRTFLGARIDYDTSERICCHNHRYAEYAGYLNSPEVDLFSRLDPGSETVWYDSVCGIPLFVAPRGRTFEEFREESLKHGWPSFRPEELVSENVIIHPGGRSECRKTFQTRGRSEHPSVPNPPSAQPDEVESKCLTHLGHNLPEGGVDRYCIDLVCVAGSPLAADDPRAEILSGLEGAVLHGEFDSGSYESSAETFSGKSGGRAAGAVLGTVAAFAAAGLAGAGAYFSLREGRLDGRGSHQPIEDVSPTVSSEKLDHTSEATSDTTSDTRSDATPDTLQ